MRLRSLLVLILAVLLVFSLSGCGSSGSEEAVPAPSQTVPQNQPEDTAEKKDVLVVVFSVTGNTREVAEKIAAITGGDLYEIKAAETYTDADINYGDKNSRTTKEQNDKSSRPALGGTDISFEGYSTVYIGYPIWWGQEPRIMDTFVEGRSFEGLTVIPFCTSGSSGIGSSGKDLAALAAGGNWLDGKRFPAGVSEDEIRSWIESLS